MSTIYALIDLISTSVSTNNNKIFKYLKSITKSNNIPSVMNFESSTANADQNIANLLILTSIFIQFS